MKLLFLKVFGLLFGGFLLVTLLSTLLLWWINSELHPDETLLEARVQRSAERLVEAWETGEFEQFQRRLKRRRHIESWLLDTNGTPLSGGPVPASLMAKISEFPALIMPKRGTAKRDLIYATEIETGAGRYRVVLATDQRGFRRANRDRLQGLFAVVMLIAFAAASLVLTLWILRPLQSIRATASAITADNLRARVPNRITQRRDAFGEVGREFNEMTSRLAASVAAQRQLLRDVSHELRTPLSRIQVATSIVAQKQGDSAETERIEAEIVRLDAMIESLLTLSRLQTTQDHVALPVNLTGLIETLVADARYEFQIDDKTVDLNLEHQGDVNGDQSLLGRALENVLRNALRFTESGTAVIVSTRREGNQIAIAVSDRGPGVPVEDLDRIFDPFYQTDQARSPDNNDGHGVGLAISRAIVKLHGGTIRATNAPEGGLTQTISLPRA